MMGPAASVVRACGDSRGTASSNAGSAAASEAAPPSIAGKRLVRGVDVDEDVDVAEVGSIMPRWIKIKGNTLSANTGKCEVCGMGKGEGGAR
jgi:hypothetical protein